MVSTPAWAKLAVATCDEGMLDAASARLWTQVDDPLFGALVLGSLLEVDLGYTPFQVAMLFLFYEIFGIFTNLVGGFLAARFGLKATLVGGLANIEAPIRKLGLGRVQVLEADGNVLR